ncbi:hypothetical protein IV38_GL001671 [Lactobacillus selangorensis]|uniref:Uncharacterized protein n=1 Tax=Lactobacillus selangorensis TaxID=81857 RepID=A0A0R2FTG5_9LACO|nr:hypothetical protein [Lactobacillus selangorensis]KRN28217.1 hypothetical protein IV38_GL001671 [Lactobacillus selangorensis]KRN30907.1 hypothetical protein IV40_GL001544 [Lactobacillus selangorensis]
MTKRSAADTATANGNPTNLNRTKEKEWGAYSPQNNVRGHDWINIRGWYQSNGDGTSYTVMTQTINGTATPVLVRACGAAVLTDGKYYLSKDVAEQQQQSDAAFESSQAENPELSE